MLVALPFFYSCKGMYDNIEEYTGEKVYPAKFDTIVGHIGYERVEIDLMKAGRISSKDMNLGKATKTVIEYENKQIIIDSLVSWVNIKDLNAAKLYRIKVYTMDEYGNKSVPLETAIIPFTEADLASLVVQSPRILSSPTSSVLDWPSGLSSILLDYKNLSYSYTDASGKEQKGQRGANPRIFLANLPPGQAVAVNINYSIIPKVNGTAILDSIRFEQRLTINTPTSSTAFIPTEAATLTKNGISEFTADAVANTRKLVFPVHTISLQDLFYFPKVEEVDLTGGDLFSMTTIAYNRNGVNKIIGGGPIMPFARRVGNMSTSNAQFLIDMLELGIIKKVKYIPNSMGIDHLLAPFVASGIVELVSLPAEQLIPFNFLIDGLLQDNAWKLDLETVSPNYPVGANLTNVIKGTLRGRSASLIFTLPKEYEFNVATYKFLKFKVYAPNKSSFDGIYAPYQMIWPRFMNYLWAFNTESTFGQQYWDANKDLYKINDRDLEKWTEISVDLANMQDKHNRVIVINIGGEPSLTFSPTKDISYYFANFRFSKTK